MQITIAGAVCILLLASLTCVAIITVGTSCHISVVSKNASTLTAEDNSGCTNSELVSSLRSAVIILGCCGDTPMTKLYC